MGQPLIVYGLAPLVNGSFETSADESVPAGWSLGDSVAGVSLTDTAFFHSAGRGLPSAKSLRQNVSNATAGNKAIAYQEPPATTEPWATLLSIVKERRIELGVAAMLRPADQIGLQNARLVIKHKVSGVWSFAPGLRFALFGGPEWYLALGAATIGATAESARAELHYDIAHAGFGATSHVWWDRVVFGGLVDLARGLRGDVEFEPDSGTVRNEGDGVAETVRVSRPATEFSFEMWDVHEFRRDREALLGFEDWHAYGGGPFAFWGDRDRLRNDDRHAQEAYIDSLSVVVPAGVLRRHYRISATAPAESVT